MTAMVEAVEVSKNFGANQVLKSITLTVAPRVTTAAM